MDEADVEGTSTSDYGTSIESSEFTSVNSSRLAHQYENGRRYQGYLEGRYGIPNDDTEQARESFKHKLYVDYILNGRVIIAPIDNNPQKIVDLGTGTGLWAQDVAERFPGARVIGTDLSPIQPSWCPPNCEFRVEDLEDEQRSWTNIYENADLIHTRSLLQTLRNPQALVQRAFDNLKPGGWYQCHEIMPATFDENGDPWPSHPLHRLWDLLDGPFASIWGWSLRIPHRIPQVLEQAGFVRIHERPAMVPVGRWHRDPRMREMGLFNLSICEDFVTAMLAKFADLGLTEEAAEELGSEIVTTMRDTRKHAQIKFVNCYAQRPVS